MTRYLFPGILPALIVLLLLTAGCSNTRYLPKDENLYIGSRVNIHDRTIGARGRRVLRRDLDGVVRPRANTKILGIRLKLTLYNLPGGNPDKKKGLRNRLRNSIGEPPVLASSVKLNANTQLMDNLMENKGFFHGTATAHWKVRRRKARAIFDVHTGPQYKIDKVVLMKDSSQVMKDIDSNFNATLLKSGAPYNLDLIKAERTRIDRMLKEKGYFYFRPDYIIVRVDSNIGERKCNMYVTLKADDIPIEAFNKYTINDVFIYANYRLRGERQDTSKEGMKLFDSYYIVDKRNRYKPKLLADAMLFEKGDRYSLDDQNKSLSRLVNMGTFKFVKNRFESVTDSLMDVYYYLTAMPRKSLRLELGAMTQSDNRTGTNASLSWRHRNAFKGAEQIMFRVNGGVETQGGGAATSAPGIYLFGAETQFSMPRFVIPFMDVQTQSRYLPRTLIQLKYRYEFQIQRLGISSYTGSYGYNWKPSPEQEHQLFPVNLTYVQTDTLGNPELLPVLYTNLMFTGLILGPTYNYIYNSQIGSVRKSGFYFANNIDLSGNILGLLQKADFESNPKELLGVTYAQYIKIQPDVRYYYHHSAATTVAGRMLLGLGIPYGNSRQLPNVKQFWAGGNSDLRGFPSRLLGPGTFNELAVYGENRAFQTLGDIKLLLQAELRQKVYQFFHMALFADAGNIWLYRPNPAFPGGEFTKDFMKQLAVDMGVGFRFDFQILLIRLDVGIPVRKPWLSGAAGQPFADIDLGSRDWRQRNMVLNLAIGYPF